MAPAPVDLKDIDKAIWAELERCVGDRSHAWRTPTLATVDDRGTPQARVVVLRECEPSARLLRFYSDARSPKVEQLRQQPRGCLVLWSPALGWQLRLQVLLQAESDGLAVSTRWARLKLSPAAQDYMSLSPPGQPLDAPAAPARESRAHFAVVTAHVQSVDWLDLAAPARRARFTADAAHWVQP